MHIQVARTLHTHGSRFWSDHSITLLRFPRCLSAGLSLPIGMLSVAIAIASSVGTSDPQAAILEAMAYAGVTIVAVWLFETRVGSGVEVTLNRPVQGDIVSEDTPFRTVPEVRRLVDEVQVRYHNDPSIEQGIFIVFFIIIVFLLQRAKLCSFLIPMSLKVNMRLKSFV